MEIGSRLDWNCGTGRSPPRISVNGGVGINGWPRRRNAIPTYARVALRVARSGIPTYLLRPSDDLVMSARNERRSLEAPNLIKVGRTIGLTSTPSQPLPARPQALRILMARAVVSCAQGGVVLAAPRDATQRADADWWGGEERGDAPGVGRLE